MIKSILIFVLTLGTALLPAVAQTLTLHDCIQRGANNNYSLRMVRNEAERAANNATKANAGYLPTVTARGNYDAALDSRNTHSKASGVVRERRQVEHQAGVGVFAEWTLFDGYKIQTNYQRLRELKAQSETQTRLAIENHVATSWLSTITLCSSAYVCTT